MSARSTWTSVAVRAEDLVAGEVAQLGGLMFTRLRKDGPLTKQAKATRARFVEVVTVDKMPDTEWVEVGFLGGDCPENNRATFCLFRPYELVRVQVERL